MWIRLIMAKKNEFKRFYEGNTLLLEMARKAPRSVIHLLKSKHTFSTHPKEKTKIFYGAIP